MTTATASRPIQSRATSAVAGLLRSREAGIFLALLIVLFVATVKNSNFLFSHDGWRDLFLSPSILLLLAVGQAMVIITRNVDLSVGSILGLTAYLTGTLFRDTGIPTVAVVLIGIAFGLGLGFVNGALVAFGKVPALVITLGTLYVYRGILLNWAGSNRINSSNIPSAFLKFGTASFLTIPLLALVSFAVLAAVYNHMRNAKSGRELYAIGSDPAAARLYGLPVTTRVLMAFAVNGALAGLAGVLFVARYGTISSNAGLGIELEAVGAAVIGGVAIFGGSGSVIGAAIGAYLLVTINRALPVVGIQDFWQRAVVGLLILGAIVLDKLLSERQLRKLLAERDAS
ncbi:MAG: ABC transporter permease [Propionibacteriales bacterium]|nr:ABC transporter permease [Propionibacteriales bacterium]